MNNLCAFHSLTDSVIRGLPFNMYSIQSVINKKYSVAETNIATAIRNHDWVAAKKFANEHLCSQFESKAHADLSKFNRVMGCKPPPCKHPSPDDMYQQVVDCILTATDENIRSMGPEMTHKVALSIRENPPWTIRFKSVIVFEVYKLWYASFTAGCEKPTVAVHCGIKPCMPTHWEHHPTVETKKCAHLMNY